MLVIALALVLLAAACAVVLTEASRSVIPPMAPINREANTATGPTTGPVSTPLTGTVTGTIPMQRMPGQVGSAKADAARAYVFVAELPAEKKAGFDSSL